MADNILINAPTVVGGKTVSTTEDGGGFQHENVIVEHVDGGGQPVKTSAVDPFPVTDGAAEAALTSIAAEDFATQATLLDIYNKLLATIAVTGSFLTDAQLRATPVPVSGTVTVTGGGDATAANQVTGNNSLASILAKIITAPSTEAKQDTIITALNSIDAGTAAALGQALMAASVPVVIASNQSAVPVSGTVAVTGAGDASAANQTLQITQETAFNTVMGLIADAAVAAGATGSISAKLRRATQGLEDLKTLIVLAAGSAIIGKVGIDQTTPGTTNLIALTAETTKAIGVIRNSDGAGNLLTSNSSTFSAKFGLDANILGTLGTAFSTPGKVDIKSTQKPSYGAENVGTVTNLQSLATSATAGWQSDRISNVATLATDYEVFFKFTTANTAPGSSKTIQILICQFYTTDGGTTWFANSGGTATLPSGTQGTYTIASPNDLLLARALNYTTQQMVVQGSFFLSNVVGTRMPDGWSAIVINDSGAALSTGCLFNYKPINDILV